MEAKLIGLSGMQGAGKDYTHEYLAAELGVAWIVKRIAFADGVREEVSNEVIAAIGGHGPTGYFGTWVKPYTDGQRFILQQWGTEFRRAQNPNYWVEYAVAKMKEQEKHVDLFVITDVRFANEARTIREHGGIVIEVVASRELRAERLGLTLYELLDRSGHASEVIDFEPDHYANNNVNGTVHLDEPVWEYIKA